MTQKLHIHLKLQPNDNRCSQMMNALTAHLTMFLDLLNHLQCSINKFIRDICSRTGQRVVPSFFFFIVSVMIEDKEVCEQSSPRLATGAQNG